MTNHTTDQLLTLGMALTADRRTMERRVRGVFARRRSAKGVLILSIMLVLALGFAAFTTACQPGWAGGRQPEVTFSDASPLHQLLDAPNRFSSTMDSVDEVFHITADFDVHLPNIASVPIARASMREFTQADLENVSRAIFGAEAVYTCPKDQTREYMDDYLESLRGPLARMLADAEPRIREIAFYQRSISYYESALVTAPAESEQRVQPLLMKKTLSPMADEAIGFSGDIMKDGYQFCLTVQNDPQSRDGYVGASSYIVATMGQEQARLYYGTVKDAPEGVAITQGEAEKQAKAIAAQLTDELQLCYSAPVHGNGINDRKEGWACVFMRAIDGCPTAFVSGDINENIMLDIPYAQAYETMTIVLDDQGIADFRWINPMTVTSVEHRKTGFMPLQEIFYRVPYELRINVLKNSTDGDKEREVTITNVSFGLMRVGASGAESFSYEPVWNFFYDFGDYDKQLSQITQRNIEFDGYPNMYGALTLSAIDGRQIDRNTGY